VRGGIKRALVPGPEPACARRVATPAADRYRGSLASGVSGPAACARFAAFAFDVGLAVFALAGPKLIEGS